MLKVSLRGTSGIVHEKHLSVVVGYSVLVMSQGTEQEVCKLVAAKEMVAQTILIGVRGLELVFTTSANSLLSNRCRPS